MGQTKDQEKSTAADELLRRGLGRRGSGSAETDVSSAVGETVGGIDTCFCASNSTETDA